MTLPPKSWIDRSSHHLSLEGKLDQKLMLQGGDINRRWSFERFSRIGLPWISSIEYTVEVTERSLQQWLFVGGHHHRHEVQCHSQRLESIVILKLESKLV